MGVKPKERAKGAGVKVLEDLRLEVTQTPVRLIELPNKVGALAEMMERLAQRKVNVDFVYGTVSPGANFAALANPEASSSPGQCLKAASGDVPLAASEPRSKST